MQKPGVYLAGAGGICNDFASADVHLAAKRKQLSAILLEFKEYATWNIFGRSKDALRWKWYDFKDKKRLPAPGHTGLRMGDGFVPDELAPQWDLEAALEASFDDDEAALHDAADVDATASVEDACAKTQPVSSEDE